MGQIFIFVNIEKWCSHLVTLDIAERQWFESENPTKIIYCQKPIIRTTHRDCRSQQTTPISMERYFSHRALSARLIILVAVDRFEVENVLAVVDVDVVDTRWLKHLKSDFIFCVNRFFLQMVCLVGFKPGPHDGRHRRIHNTIKAFFFILDLKVL